jgi:hypothetical protein
MSRRTLVAPATRRLSRLPSGPYPSRLRRATGRALAVPAGVAAGAGVLKIDGVVAGGLVVDTSGEQLTMRSASTVATPPELVDSMLDQISADA